MHFCQYQIPDGVAFDVKKIKPNTFKIQPSNDTVTIRKLGLNNLMIKCGTNEEVVEIFLRKYAARARLLAVKQAPSARASPSSQASVGNSPRIFVPRIAPSPAPSVASVTSSR